jgi:hypothetical protein
MSTTTPTQKKASRATWHPWIRINSRIRQVRAPRSDRRINLPLWAVEALESAGWL